MVFFFLYIFRFIVCNFFFFWYFDISFFGIGVFFGYLFWKKYNFIDFIDELYKFKVYKRIDKDMEIFYFLINNRFSGISCYCKIC